MLALLAFLLAPTAYSATFSELSCGRVGSKNSATYAILAKNKKPQLIDAGYFASKKLCEETLDRGKGNPGNFVCAPSSTTFDNMYGVFHLGSGIQIGRSLFDHTRCEELAATGKPNFVCSLEYGIGSTKLKRFDSRGNPPTDSQYPSLEACTHLKQNTQPQEVVGTESSAE